MAVADHPLITIKADKFKFCLAGLVKAEAAFSVAADHRAQAMSAFMQTLTQESCTILGSYVDDVICAFYELPNQ